MGRFDAGRFDVIATGLAYPEGPVACDDGSVLLVEVKGGTLTRVKPDGSKETVATLGGSPNGAARGPGGKVYVCNSGGFVFIPVPPGPVTDQTVWVTGPQPADYQGGSVQRVDGSRVETLFTHFESHDPVTQKPVALPLRGPDDLVFDATGGFWFSDWGKTRMRDRDVTGVYYAPPGGSKAVEALFPLNAPNGIALSPGGDRLYVAETYTRRVLYWELDSPGRIRRNPRTISGSYLLSAALPGQGILDSMAVDEQGNVYVVTMLPDGDDPTTNGGITILSPRGEVLQFLEIDVGRPVPLPSNICFGGEDLKTAFVTCGGSGLLVSIRMSVPGLKLCFG